MGFKVVSTKKSQYRCVSIIWFKLTCNLAIKYRLFSFFQERQPINQLRNAFQLRNTILS